MAPKKGVKKSADQLANDAHVALVGLQVDRAHQLITAALNMEPSNAAFHELHGEILLEMGDAQHALVAFQRALSLNPDGASPSVLMNLGQLSVEEEALAYYRAGAERLAASIQNIEAGREEGVADDLRRQLSECLCASAEIFLTDCCELEGAEQQCEALLLQAVAAWPSNYEVGQLVASMRLSQCRNDDAKAALLESISLWVNLDEIEKPSIDFRLSTVRLLLELSLLEEAEDLVASLLVVDDEHVDVWCTTVIIDMMKGDWVAAAGHLHKLKRLLSRMVEEDLDDALVDEVNERMATVAAELAAVGDNIDNYEWAEEDMNDSTVPDVDA